MTNQTEGFTESKPLTQDSEGFHLLLEYRASLQLAMLAHTLPGNAFYALLMATIREADSDNLAKLALCFPQVLAELTRRYSAPGGRLDTERK